MVELICARDPRRSLVNINHVKNGETTYGGGHGVGSDSYVIICVCCVLVFTVLSLSCVMCIQSFLVTSLIRDLNRTKQKARQLSSHSPLRR